jgi:peptidoglycan-associated lipoprotein
MRRARLVSVFAGTLAAALAGACGPKSISGPARPGQTLIVLLPDVETGATGRASVRNHSDSVELAAERDATLATANRRFGVATLSEPDVARLFGDALSALPPAPRRFVFYFLFESDQLIDESRALVPDVLTAVDERSAPDVVIVGHADSMGTPQANYELGLKRATMVRDLLVEAGLDVASIDVTSHGEAELLLKTPDQTPEQQNRRVEILVR